MLEPLILISTVLFFTWLYNTLNKPKPYNPDRDLINVLDFATRNMKSHSTHFNQGNQFMSPEDKRAYLKSTKWKLLRTAVIKRDKHCQACGSPGTQVHNLRYDSLGNEPLSDLIFTLWRTKWMSQ